MRRASVAGPVAAPIHLSVSDLPPPSFTAELIGPCVLLCCGAFIQCGGDSATDLQAVRYRARANWIGPEPDSVLRLVRSLDNNRNVLNKGDDEVRWWLSMGRPSHTNSSDLGKCRPNSHLVKFSWCSYTYFKKIFTIVLLIQRSPSHRSRLKTGPARAVKIANNGLAR